MEVNTHHRVVVTERSHVSGARLEARDMARGAGFTEEDDYRVGLVVTELATNLVKHTGAGGEILLRALHGSGGDAIEILALDRGPGIGDVAHAFEDGVSSADSPGTGLGAMRRLSDVFDVHSSPVGTATLARIATRRTVSAPSAFTTAGVSVAMSGETVAGDLWSVVETGETLTLVLADGLGHGVAAHAAARAVLDAADQPAAPRVILERTHLAVRHTRGAAAAVAQLRRGDPTLTFAGVGNISGFTRDGAAQHQMVSVNGILGHQAHAFRQFAYPWSADSLLVMFSDGLTSRWSLDRYPGLAMRHPALIAGVLYRDFSRQRDDVTVLVAMEAA
jgi:anti-sigma regulatory factor (Ser/Thr protein kinase)